MRAYISSLPVLRMASTSGPASATSISATSPASIVFLATVRLGLPTSARSCFWSRTICRMTAWPSPSARIISASGISLAPDSTITMASSVPATRRFSLLFVRRSDEGGFTTTWSSQ
jgi:hypothetical protein